MIISRTLFAGKLKLTKDYFTGSEVFDFALGHWKTPTPSLRFNNRFEKLDGILRGLRPHEFTILCGATGVGKTTLLANWSLSLLEGNVPHYVASIETGYSDYCQRICSAALNDDELTSGDVLSKQKIQSIKDKCEVYFRKQLLCFAPYENRLSVEKLIEDIKFQVDYNRCKVAFIDNLNFFLEVTSAQNSVVEMDRVIHELILFCKRTPVHVVMVMHPKKTTNGRVDSEFDIKGSSTAVQEAHNVLLFNKISEHLITQAVPHYPKTCREIKFAKMRRRGKYAGGRLVIMGGPVAYSEGGFYEN